MELKPNVELNIPALTQWYKYGEPFASAVDFCEGIIRDNQDLFE